MSWHPWIILLERAWVGWTKEIAQTTQLSNIIPTFLYRNNRLSRNYVLLETITRKES
jgi:hypothetical protein